MKLGDTNMRRRALELTTVLEPDAARAILAMGLHDDTREVAESAVRSLGQLGGSYAVDSLGGVLTREGVRPEIRRAAADALDQLGGGGIKSYAGLIEQFKTGTEGAVAERESESGEGAEDEPSTGDDRGADIVEEDGERED